MNLNELILKLNSIGATWSLETDPEDEISIQLTLSGVKEVNHDLDQLTIGFINHPQKLTIPSNECFKVVIKHGLYITKIYFDIR